MSQCVKYKTDAPVSGFMRGFEVLRRNSDMTDLTIVAQGQKQCKVHRAVLAAQFPRLKTVIRKASSNQLLLKKFPLRVINAALDYAYTGEVDITDDIVHLLYLLASSLGSQKIRGFCLDFLESRINAANVCDTWVVANSMLDKNLMAMCLPTLQEQLEELVLNERMLRFTQLEGMLMICEGVEDHSRGGEEGHVTRFISAWIEGQTSPEVKDTNRAAFESTVADLDLSTFNAEQLVQLLTLASELGAAKNCRNHLTSAIRSSISRLSDSQVLPSSSVKLSEISSSKNAQKGINSSQPENQCPMASSSTSQNEQIGKSQNKVCSELVYAVVNNNNKYFVKNIPLLKNPRETYTALTNLSESQFTSIGNWIVAIGSYGNQERFIIFDVIWQVVYSGPPPRFCHHSKPPVAATSNFVYVFDGGYNQVFEVGVGRWSNLPVLNYCRNHPLAQLCSTVTPIFHSICPIPEDDVFIYYTDPKISKRCTVILRRQAWVPDSQGGAANSWIVLKLPDMVHQRDKPTSTYFDNRIFVAGGNKISPLTLSAYQFRKMAL